jgi:hypothetical protein
MDTGMDTDMDTATHRMLLQTYWPISTASLSRGNCWTSGWQLCVRETPPACSQDPTAGRAAS